uniref:phosphodiester glycosidase family protein n=1 Tax=Pararhizobium sp. IMCC3301 TaxID=3067904 RepID=UPI00274286C6|nr:phosphodiester glycosidase family protein [Pararhizobium sp. IMCC3301]
MISGPTGSCETVRFDGTRYTVCGFDPTTHDIRLFHRDDNGTGFADFAALETFLDSEGLQLSFAMNAGMYHADRDPVGLYVEQGIERSPVNQNEGPGNFHLLPNGVFYLVGSAAGILETQAYLTSGIEPDFATQSGPMLIIDGELHPRFLQDGTSRKIRNGVGIAADGRTIVFALSEDRVNFYDFARLFRDRFGAKNALYLDGSISRLYIRDLERSDPGRAMGPIVGVVATKPAP